MIFLTLFWVFFKIGLFSFGGGYAMVAVIQNEVGLRSWCTASQYVDIVTISQMAPGAIAANVATFVGANALAPSGHAMSVLGAVVAALGVSLPSFILVVLAAKLYEKIVEKKATQWVLMGIRAAVVGLIANAVLFFMRQSILAGGRLSVTWHAFGTPVVINFGALAIFAAVLILAAKTKLGTVWLILISMALGLALI